MFQRTLAYPLYDVAIPKSKDKGEKTVNLVNVREKEFASCDQLFPISYTASNCSPRKKNNNFYAVNDAVPNER